MRRLLTAALFGLLLLAPAAAFWQSRDSNYNQNVVSGSYTGPLDLSLGSATVVAYWGLRCGSTSYTGNVADIWDAATGSTTETLLTCSAGGTINQTINSLSTTCSVSCAVKEFYDQTGNGHNATQATNSRRPILTQNCVNTSLPCAASIIANSSSLSTASFSQTQPFTLVTSSEFTSADTGRRAVLGGGGGNIAMGWRQSSSACQITAGTEIDSTTAFTVNCNENTWYTQQAAFNGASSSWSINGTNHAGLSVGTNALSSAAFFISDDGGSNYFTGNFYEGIMYSGAMNSTDMATLNTNMCKSANKGIGIC